MDGDTPVRPAQGSPSSARRESLARGWTQISTRRDEGGAAHRDEGDVLRRDEGGAPGRGEGDVPPLVPPRSRTDRLTQAERPRQAAGGILVSLGASLLEVVLPVQCVGCGQWDTLLCPGCAALAEGSAEWEVLDGPTRSSDLGVWSLGEYAGRLRGIVLAAKHRPAVDLTGFLGAAGRTLGHGIVAAGVLAGAREVWVVPAPSGWRRRYRDQMVAPVVADGVAREVAVSAGIRTRVVEPVALRPFTGSQSGRSGGERRSGRLDSMVTRLEVPAGVGVVLADDVVTTGATLRELARVCGPGTVAAATLCRVGGQGQGTEGTSPDLGPYDLGHPGDV